MSIFSEKRIVLGVTGSITTYKAENLASKLTDNGYHVTYREYSGGITKHLGGMMSGAGWK